MENPALKAKYDLKELELKALLEITQSINNNLPENSLYKIYEFTVRANLNIKKLALYVFDEAWSCKVNYGTKSDYLNVPLEEAFLNYEKITNLDGLGKGSSFEEFNVLIPVAHKERKLAFVFLGGHDQENGEMLNTNFIQALSNIIIVAIENKKLARKQIEQEMIRRELEIAGKVQQFLFPKDLPYTDRLKVAAFYQPHHSIGGDYYDFVRMNKKQFLFCIADVSGKGIPAALLMSNFQASLRTLVRQTILLQDIITELNYQIIYNAEGQHFITFFVGIYDASRSRFKYVNAGHIPPILIQDGKKEMQLNEGTTVLGAFNELPFLKIGIIENIDEFMICSFTDGLTEVVNEQGEQFDGERVYEVVRNHAEDEPDLINEKVIEHMNEFKGNTSFLDDITLFTCWLNNKKHK